MQKQIETYDVVVCGGGLAGYCAALAAARHGAKTCLVHDRPVLGGTSSSEVRVPPHGAAAFHAYARETGILGELLAEERAKNHETIAENGWTNSVWDLVLYDKATSTPNLTFHLNSTVTGVRMAGSNEVIIDALAPNKDRGYYHRPACNPSRQIEAVFARVGQAEVELELRGKQFIDCTGDGVVGDLCGCEWRMGSEGKAELDEPHAPAEPSTDTMGNSIHFKTRDIGKPAPYAPPAWAHEHNDPAYFYEQGRRFYDLRSGYWWIEVGMPWHTIYDNEAIRHELTRRFWGIWDWMKNRDPKLMDRTKNLALDWIGQVPGKRDSRRIIGHYFFNEHDPVNKTVFADEIGHGGWFIDIHTPGGLLADCSEPASKEGYAATSDYAIKSYAGPYGMPLSMCIAKDMDNLMMAGRDVSCTHAAMGTVRVMATCALQGQACGTAAAMAIAAGAVPVDIDGKEAPALQQHLLRDGVFLLNTENSDAADLARSASVTASSEALVTGAGPASLGETGGVHFNAVDLESRTVDLLEHRRGQWIACGIDRIEWVEVLLSNNTDRPQSLEAKLVPVEHIWDYRCDTGSVLASVTVEVASGRKQWVRLPIAAKVKAGTYVRLDLMANKNLQWHESGRIVPGHTSAFEMGRGRMRRYHGQGRTLSFRMHPAQPAYGPANVIRGATRPYRFTNLWRSDPAQPLEQWLELSWSAPQTVGRVELTFPGHLFQEYHAYPPFYRDPQCAKDYRVEAWVDGGWKSLARAEGNYQPRRQHAFEAVKTSRLRVVIETTNGDPSAAVYEVRCYA